MEDVDIVEKIQQACEPVTKRVDELEKDKLSRASFFTVISIFFACLGSLAGWVISNESRSNNYIITTTDRMARIETNIANLASNNAEILKILTTSEVIVEK